MAKKTSDARAKKLVEGLLRKGVKKAEIAFALETTERSIDRVRLDGAKPRPGRMKKLVSLAKRKGIPVPSPA